MIQSIENQRIKDVYKLYQKKYRVATHSFLIEGEKMLKEALTNSRLTEQFSVREIYRSEDFSFTEIDHEYLQDYPQTIVSERVFSHLSALQSPRGCIAVIERNEWEWTDFDVFQIDQQKPNDGSLVLLLDGIQDPGNVGTIIRIADAVGAKAVILGDGCADPYSDKVVRATMGSLFHVPIITEELMTVIAKLKQAGYRIVAADLVGDSYYSNQPSWRTGFVLGSEGRGISQEIKGQVDTFLTIPMPGDAESLNVSVAAGILAFDIRRQWEEKRAQIDLLGNKAGTDSREMDWDSQIDLQK